MSRVYTLCTVILSLLATCTAQKLHVCTFSGVSEVGHTQGVDIQRVAVIEPNSEVKATVFIPDGSEPLPGIVFSHSAIHGASNNTDLLRFAWALARAGAASIVLDGAIDWQSPNDESIRPPELQFCAGQWLLQHVNIDLTRAADAGNHKLGWIENDVSPCGVEVESGKARCWPGGLWLGFGQTGQAESRNTDSLLTLEGEVWMAQFAQKHLKLKEVKPEWLTETTQPFSR
ncbi:MAG: hypothetical protein WA555_02155 [Candidatus Sulfotelmatobacter sp.]